MPKFNGLRSHAIVCRHDCCGWPLSRCQSTGSLPVDTGKACKNDHHLCTAGWPDSFSHQNSKCNMLQSFCSFFKEDAAMHQQQWNTVYIWFIHNVQTEIKILYRHSSTDIKCMSQQMMNKLVKNNMVANWINYFWRLMAKPNKGCFTVWLHKIRLSSLGFTYWQVMTSKHVAPT